MTRTRIIIKIGGLCLLSLLETLYAQDEGPNSKSSNFDHGEKQVTALLLDRPQLKHVVQNSSAMRDWLVDAFSYSVDGIEINWDPKPISDSFSPISQTDVTIDSKICFIRANRYYKSGANSGKEIDEETLISYIAFELCNARHHQGYIGIVQQAQKGVLSKDQFIIAIAQIEYEAEKDLKVFATTIWFPYCLDNKIEPNIKTWIACWPPTFEEWMELYPRGSEYPWKIYGYRYDQIIDSDKTKEENK